VDAECRREAEVIRQVRESDHHSAPPSQPNTTASSPALGATATAPVDAVDDLSDGMSIGTSIDRQTSSNFGQHALKNSAGPEFWENFDSRMQTPPPLHTLLRENSSIMSEGFGMDTPASSTMLNTMQNPQFAQALSRSRPSTPQPPPVGQEVTSKLGKRRRDDDLDPYIFKRRAVSPGVSHQNSPVLPSSPAQQESSLSRSKGRDFPNNHVQGERTNNGNTTVNNSNGIGKRVGMRGMNDTKNGLMNMSI
jgi:hypothetical protein